MNGVSSKQFGTDLWQEIENDIVFNGASALAYCLLPSLFPAAILLMTLLPCLLPNPKACR
jgi:uncharacterized BrkB/YihY/UPF0761 family membrane protein